MYENFEPLREFNFNRKFEGLVVDTSKFDETNEIDVIIQDIIMVNTNYKIDITESISFNNILNINDFNINNTITNANYITCKPLVFNDDIHSYKPQVNDRVLVNFYNGNPKMPYYENKYYPIDIISQPPENFRPIYDGPENTYYRIIRYIDYHNMRGKDIDTLAEQLINLDYAVYKNGDEFMYDEDFVDVVKLFQKDNNLVIDGIVGPITFTKVIENNRRKESNG